MHEGSEDNKELLKPVECKNITQATYDNKQM